MNAYAVLGVKETATESEIQAAYRALVKKYHPDKYTDPVMKDKATSKLQEINTAYESLTKGTGSSASQDYSRDYSGSYSGAYSSEFTKVEQLINRGQYESAMAMLDAMSVRNARWNYLYGVICMQRGNHTAAAQYFEMAYRSEPGNVQYRNAYQRTHMDFNMFNREHGRYSDSSDSTECCSCCTALATFWCCYPMCSSCFGRCC